MATLPQTNTPFLLVPGKDHAPTNDRILERRLNQPGIQNSIVQEQIFNGACTAQTATALVLTQITGITNPINFTKLFPGTTIRVKFQITSFGSAANMKAQYSVGIGNTTPSILGIDFHNDTFHHPSLQLAVDFPAASFLTVSTGKGNVTGTIQLLFFVNPFTSGVNWTIDTNDFFQVIVSEIAP